MIDIVFANAAEADLIAIDAFSAERFGDDRAERYMRGSDMAFGRLIDFPLSGRLTPELGKRMRCLRQERHLIYYRVDAEAVLIVRILHHAMDARTALRDFS